MADREWEALRCKGSAASHAKVPQDCGPVQHRCRVDGSHGGIVYCPMHKAAPEMQKALDRCEGAMDRLNGDTGTAKRPCWFCLADQYDGAVGIIHDAEDCAILEARKALAQARGQEVRP